MPRDSGSSRTKFISPSIPAPGRGPLQPNPSPTSPADAVKKRTSHACDRCRLMRTKCSGGARCVRCTKDDAVCVYGDHKRERNKKDLVESSQRIRELEDENRILVSALRSLSDIPDFHAQEHPGVVDLLAKYPQEDRAESSQSQESRSRTRSITRSIASLVPNEPKSEKGGELKAPSSVGSPGHQGELQRIVDLDRGTGAAGFVGKMSETSWMQRCREHLANQRSLSPMDIKQPEYDQHTTAAVDLSYFMDDVDLLYIDEDHIDSLRWPSFDLAVVTTEAFFEATKGAFYFLSRERFLETMYAFLPQNSMPSWDQRKWLAVANLVWAIGSKWLHLAKFHETSSSDTHLLYYARARALGLDHRVSFDHPDVDMVQAIGLMAFYLLINGSISRAWNTVGNAVRHAETLGLHLKVSDPSISSLEKARRAQTWFSLYKLQMLISEITGRPQLIRTPHVTIPMEILEQPMFDRLTSDSDNINLAPSMRSKEMWRTFLRSSQTVIADMWNRESAEIGSVRLGLPISQQLFLYHVRLTQLSEEIADQLYTGRQEQPWSQTQLRIEELQRALDAWTCTLPDELKLNPGWNNNPHLRANLSLAMYSYSLSMILHRPCLCEIHIENESDVSKDFNLVSARSCVNAAISLLGLLPDDIVVHQIHQLFPWWTILHYLCQAGAVLLLELCLDSQHFQGEIEHILGAMWKTMSYLACLTEESKSAYKAWRIFQQLLRRVSVRYGDPKMFEVSQEATPPQQWTTKDENFLLNALTE